MAKPGRKPSTGCHQARFSAGEWSDFKAMALDGRHTASEIQIEWALRGRVMSAASVHKTVGKLRKEAGLRRGKLPVPVGDWAGHPEKRITITISISCGDDHAAAIVAKIGEALRVDDGGPC